MERSQTSRPRSGRLWMFGRDRNLRSQITILRWSGSSVREVEVAPVEELPPGSMRLVPAGARTIGVYNCAGTYYAIEDRCSHDDGPLCEGDWEPELCIVVCPRHGSRFDLQTGIPMTLPAFESVPTYPVFVRDGIVVVQVPA